MLFRSQQHQQKPQQHRNPYQTNIRFMVMKITGITFFFCILFVFVQSAVYILYDRHHKPFHLDRIVSDTRSNDMERFAPSSSISCCNDGTLTNRCTFRQLGQIMVPSAYQSMIDTIQRHMFTSSSCNQTNDNFKKNRNHDHETLAATTTTSTTIMTTCLQPPSHVNNIGKNINKITSDYFSWHARLHLLCS